MAKAQNQTVPEYVDTKTPIVQWYIFNGIILLGSWLMASLAALIVEFELAKLTHPAVGFINSPTWLDLTISGIVMALAIANMTVLLFVFWRHLRLRRWMVVTTMIGWMLIATQALVLNDRYLYILIPSFH